MKDNTRPSMLKSYANYSYEADFIQGLLRKHEKKLGRSFNFKFRYIYDVLSLNNSRFGDFVDRIYPIELRDKYSICICCWNVATYKWKVRNGKIEIISFVVISFLTDPHCRFRGVSQGMKQTEATELRVPFGHFENFKIVTMTWLTVIEYLCHK
jgi:hypothetical protein